MKYIPLIIILLLILAILVLIFYGAERKEIEMAKKKRNIKNWLKESMFILIPAAQEAAVNPNTMQKALSELELPSI